MFRWIGWILVACHAPSVEPQRAPPGALSVELPGMYPGHTSAVFATGVHPGERIHHALSLTGTGAGPCPGVLGGQCLGLSQPIYLGSMIANDNGEALLPVSVPDTAPVGEQVCFQGAVGRGAASEVSSAVCGVIDAPEPCLTGTTEVEIGTGEGSFEPLVSGQDLQMVHGGQGGWHLPIAINVFGLTDIVTLDINLIDTLSGESVSYADPQSLSLTMPPLPGSTSTCDGQLIDVVAFLDFTDIGGIGASGWQELCGHEVRIDVIVRDYRGPGVLGPVLGGGSAYVIAQPDPIDGPPCAP